MMNHYRIYGVILILIIASGYILSSCSTTKYKQNVLIDKNNTNPWKIIYVTESTFPISDKTYFEVYYNKNRLVITKEIFGSIDDISKFTTAGVIDAG